MEIGQFLLFQFLAHILADYFFQTNKQANQKNELGFRSRFLYWHILVVFVSSWILSFQLKFVIGAAIIAAAHFLIDGFKAMLNKSKSVGHYIFFIDQFAHILVLTIVSLIYVNHFDGEYYWIPPVSERMSLLIVAYLMCLKPANIIIKEVFRASKIDTAIAKKEGLNELDQTDELPNAGKLIGILERLLALTFIVLNHYEAVGFLIAAKSILRYKDTDTHKSEYVLIGTMLSFGIAVGLGVLASLY